MIYPTHTHTHIYIYINFNKSKGYIVIPYVQGLSESIRNICSKYYIQTYFNVNRTIKNKLVSLKYIDPIQCKIGTNVTGLTVMRNILEKPLVHLGKDIRNTSKHSLLYMTTIPLLAI